MARPPRAHSARIAGGGGSRREHRGRWQPASPRHARQRRVLSLRARATRREERALQVSGLLARALRYSAGTHRRTTPGSRSGWAASCWSAPVRSSAPPSGAPAPLVATPPRDHLHSGQSEATRSLGSRPRTRAQLAPRGCEKGAAGPRSAGRGGALRERGGRSGASAELRRAVGSGRWAPNPSLFDFARARLGDRHARHLSARALAPKPPCVAGLVRAGCGCRNCHGAGGPGWLCAEAAARGRRQQLLRCVRACGGPHAERASTYGLRRAAGSAQAPRWRRD